MSLFDQLGENRQQNPMQQLRADPVGFAQKAGFNIPAGMNNPQQMIKYLLQSGQVPQARYAQAMQMLTRKR